MVMSETPWPIHALEDAKAKWGKSDSSQANVKTAEPLVNSRKLVFSIGKERKAHHFRRSPEYAGDLYKANLPSGFRDIQ